MKKDCANLSDFSDYFEVSAMLREECSKCFQSFASMTREVVSAEVGTGHWPSKYSTGQ